MEETLNKMKVSVEQCETEKKVMMNMVSRIKFDKIVYDQRKYNLEKQLVFIGKQQNIILKENSGTKEEDDRSKKVYQKLLQHL